MHGRRSVQARQVAFHVKFELGIDVDGGGSAWRNAAAMWLKLNIASARCAMDG